MDKIVITYTPSQVDRLLRGLADAPYKLVADIIGTTAAQADAQAAEANKANGAAGGEVHKIVEVVAPGEPTVN